jgi:DNA polymerase-1
MKTLETTWIGEPYTIHYFETWDEVVPHIKKIKSYNTLGVDIETGKKAKYLKHKSAGLCPYLSDIRLLQIYGGDSVVYVFDCATIPFSKFHNLLNNKVLVAHNALFEYKHFLHNGCKRDLDIHCTMLMYGLEMKAKIPEYQDVRFSLDAAVSDKFKVRVDKNLQVSNWNGVLSLEQIRYAAIDAIAALRLAKIVKPQLEKFQLVKVYKMMKDLIPVIAEMELEGVKLDLKKHNKYIEQFELQRKELDKQIDKYFGGVNPTSGKQFHQWVCAHIKPDVLKDWPTTKGGLYSGDANTLSSYQHIPAIAALSSWKESFKVLNTYGKSLQETVHPVTGRVHTGFKLLQTRTGRLSSYAPNIQNFPRDKEFRELFVAAEGKKLIVSDFSQIETRVAGIVSKDPVINEAYISGQDIYKLFASKLYKKSIEDVTKAERQHAKTAILGFAYGMSYKKLQQYAKMSGVDLELKTCEKLFNGYHTVYKVYSGWCNQVRAYYTPKGFVKTKLGRIRRLEKYEGEYNGYTTVPNTIIQGSAAEIMFCAMNHFWKKNLPGVKMLLTVHDEVVLECDEDVTENACLELVDSMTAGMLEVYPGACTKGLAEAFSGSNWHEAKH